ncbi:Rab geranylgeranyltransferase [Geranomyces michiganensis]|nr:Rab geranylgeranyltransferase [Geranomyces michiganensis]
MLTATGSSNAGCIARYLRLTEGIIISSRCLNGCRTLASASSNTSTLPAPQSSRPAVYPRLRSAAANTATPSVPVKPTSTLKINPQKAFLARLKKDGGPRILTFRRNVLHTEYTRFLTLCDQVKGLSLDQALLQIKWLRKPITKKMEDAISEAIVKARESGFDLGKTYIADAYVKQNAAILQTYLVKRYLRGRGRYGATPHPVSTLLELTLQERDKPFAARESDPLEWVRDRLRERQKPFAKTAEEVYEEHHQKKVKTTDEEREAQRQRSIKKLAEYKALCSLAASKRHAKEYDDDAFNLTTKLLSLNPEFYTMWNFRRQIILDRRTTIDSEAYQGLCLSELQLADAALKINPKSYWVWNHRRWILENMPEAAWTRELKLLGRILDMDARNFHGWGYRRYVIASSGARSPWEEFNYTTEKISQNFSNYSAWHYRSKVLVQAFTDPAERAEVIENEFELVRNAIYTEPADQSAWLYQRWLLSLVPQDTNRWSKELGSIQELVEIEPESKWALLSIVHIMLHLGQRGDEVAGILKQLQLLDPDRAEFYKDAAISATIS